MAAMKNFLIYFYFYDLLNAKLSCVSYSLITFEYQRYFPLSINPLCRWIACYRMPTQTVRLRFRLRQHCINIDYRPTFVCVALMHLLIYFVYLMNKIDRRKDILD